MTTALIVLALLLFLFARWARQEQQQDRLLEATRSGFSWLAGRIGVANDVVVTSVLVDSGTVLLGFRPAHPPRHSPGEVAESGLEQILLAPGSDPQATIARLRRWEASGATVVMWRDRIVGSVELTHLFTGQQVTLSVLPRVPGGTVDA